MEGRLTLGTCHLRISCIAWLTVAYWPMVEDSTESTRATVRGAGIVTFSTLTRKLQGAVCIILASLLFNSACWDEVDKKYYLVIYLNSHHSYSFVHTDTRPLIQVG